MAPLDHNELMNLTRLRRNGERERERWVRRLERVERVERIERVDSASLSEIMAGDSLRR